MLNASLRRKFRLVKTLFISRLSGHRPFILSHLITNRCNLDCATCLWKEPPEATTKELSTIEIEQLYRDACNSNFLDVVIWGGEPLLRQDLGRLLQFAQSQHLSVTIITNGYSLAERAQEIAPYINTLIVSIDALSDKHDYIRGAKGAYQRAIAGMEVFRNKFPQVKLIIISVISRLNSDSIEELIQLAYELDLPLTFQSMNCQDYGAVNRKIDVSQLSLDRDDEKKVFELIQSYKAKGYRITNSFNYLRAFINGTRQYRCHYKKMVLRVEANGDVLDCTGQNKVLTNVREHSLKEILRSNSYRSFLKRAEACSVCLDAGTMEASYLWSLRPEALWNAIKMLPG